MKKHLIRPPEDTVIKREQCRGILVKILHRSIRHSLNQDCRAHLDEMKQSPTYFPEGIIIADLRRGLLE